MHILEKLKNEFSITETAINYGSSHEGRDACISTNATIGAVINLIDPDAPLPEISTRFDAITALTQLQDVVKSRIAQINADSLQLLEVGIDIDGHKLVVARTKREWRSEAEVSTAMTDLGISPAQLYDMKLKGIPKIEKVLSAAGFKPARRTEILETLITETVGKPTLSIK